MKKIICLFILIFLIFSINFNVNADDRTNQLISSINKDIKNENYSSAIKETSKLLNLLKDKLNNLTTDTVDPNFKKLLNTCENPAKIPLPGNDELYIKYGDTKYYIIEQEAHPFEDYTIYGFGHLYAETKNNANIINNYMIGINDKVENINYKSSNPEILEINKNGRFEIKNNGNVVVSVSLLDKKVHIPIKIIKLPIKERMSKEEVIEILGMPDGITDTYISWPDSKYVDGIYYYRTGNGLGQSILHWFYDEHPDAIIRFNVLDELTGVIMASWDNVPRY